MTNVEQLADRGQTPVAVVGSVEQLRSFADAIDNSSRGILSPEPSPGLLYKDILDEKVRVGLRAAEMLYSAAVRNGAFQRAVENKGLNLSRVLTQDQSLLTPQLVLNVVREIADNRTANLVIKAAIREARRGSLNGDTAKIKAALSEMLPKPEGTTVTLGVKKATPQNSSGQVRMEEGTQHWTRLRANGEKRGPGRFSSKNNKR